MIKDSEAEAIKNSFIQSVLSGMSEKEKEKYLKTSNMARDVIDYIIRQLNEHSLKSKISFLEYAQMYEEAVYGLALKIYVENYEDEDPIFKDSLYISSKNFMQLLYNRVLHHVDYELTKAQIDAQKQTVVMSPK